MLIQPSVRMLLGLSFGLMTLAGPTHHVVGMVGARNVYRGSAIYAMLDHHWYDFTPVTPIAGTSRILAPQHSFKEGAKIGIHSIGGAAPSIVNAYRTYEVCDVEPAAFTLVPDSSSSCKGSYQRVSFTDSGTGAVQAARDAGIHKSVYLSETVEGLPAGVSITFYCGNVKCPKSKKLPGHYLSYGGNVSFKFRIHASEAAPLGKATLRFTLRVDGEATPKTSDFPIEVRAFQPVAEAKWTSAGAPPQPLPIPGIEKWEATMKTLAAKWCTPGLPVPAMLFGVETQVWYYDGANVYFQVADYTKDSRWKDCATGLAKQYHGYVLKSGGAIPAWRAFAHGMRRADKEASHPDYDYAAALAALAENGRWKIQISVVTTEIRETAYYLMTAVEYERKTGIRLEAVQRNAELLMGMFDQLFVSNKNASHQIWMDGLAARALIEYHSLTNDPKALYFVKLAADWIWANGRVAGSPGLMTNAEPVGPNCDWGCQNASADLVQLVAPLYAWCWWKTGDPVYRSRGDELFAQAAAANISYSGKVFSQNYTWSFEYVRWRNLIPGYVH